MTGATEPVQPVQPADPQPPENLYAIILRDTDPALIVRTTLTPEDMAEAIAPSGKGKVFAVIAGAAVRVADVLAITTAQAYAESLALGCKMFAVAMDPGTPETTMFNAVREWRQVAAMFGLNPADRSRIQIEKRIGKGPTSTRDRSKDKHAG